MVSLSESYILMYSEITGSPSASNIRLYMKSVTSSATLKFYIFKDFSESRFPVYGYNINRGVISRSLDFYLAGNSQTSGTNLGVIVTSNSSLNCGANYTVNTPFTMNITSNFTLSSTIKDFIA